jgi:hypothetical protein
LAFTSFMTSCPSCCSFSETIHRTESCCLPFLGS